MLYLQITVFVLAVAVLFTINIQPWSKKVKRIALPGALALLTASAGMAHADFVGVFHKNLLSGPNDLFVFGAEGTTGTITANGTEMPFTIDASGVFTDLFGVSGNEMTTSGDVNGLSFFVHSDDAISGIALNRAPQTTDQTLLLDTEGLGTEYVVLTTPGVFGDGAQMSVTAIADDTEVTITSPVDIAGHAADTPFTVTLDKGQSVFYSSGGGNDLSGAHISATKNVAVFGGDECTQVPVGIVACDHLISQQFSTDNFDTDFLVAGNFGGGTDGDLVRVIGATDNTKVFLDGVLKGTIDAGEVLQLDNVTNGRITASEPITVGQFIRGEGGTRTLGDPAFAIIPSVDQLLKSYAFITPVGADAFVQNFINVAISIANAPSLILDGLSVDTSGFASLGGYLFGNVAIEQGSGTISADAAFLATISGFSDFDSYFSPIATSFSPGVSPPPPPPPSGVPLPAGLLLLLPALAGLGALGRRRRRD